MGQTKEEVMEEFLALYSEAGMIGVVGAMFVFMVYQNAKRAEQQAEDLEALKVENEGQSKNIENIESIVLKFLDRWNRSDETRDRRHEDLVKEIIGIDMSKQMQSSDWGAEKLSDKQLKYAASDVIYLHKIKSELNKMLVRENRINLHENCLKFIDTRVDLDLADYKHDIFSH